ncbi:MAG: hypothetical protein ACI4C3_08355, partial [Bacteroides sp.]
SSASCTWVIACNAEVSLRKAFSIYNNVFVNPSQSYFKNHSKTNFSLCSTPHFVDNREIIAIYREMSREKSEIITPNFGQMGVFH